MSVYKWPVRHSRENGNPENTKLDSGLRTAGMTDKGRSNEF